MCTILQVELLIAQTASSMSAASIAPLHEPTISDEPLKILRRYRIPLTFSVTAGIKQKKHPRRARAPLPYGMRWPGRLSSASYKSPRGSSKRIMVKLGSTSRQDKDTIERLSAVIGELRSRDAGARLGQA